MPEYRRLYERGGTYFFTVVTCKRRPILTSDAARACLRQAWVKTGKRMPFRTDAVCLLPDHLHCIWVLPEGDAAFSARWRLLKGFFTRLYLEAGGKQGTRSASREARGEAAVWQRRFWEHRIRDEKDYGRHVDYIHFNPVKHGLTEWPGDWPWSSFHRWAAEGWYDRAWGMREPESLRALKIQE